MIASVLPLLCLTTQLFALTASAAAFPRDQSQNITTNATAHVLQYHHMGRGHKIKPGTELRILPVGDSITVGFHSNLDGGDGNGYRLKLKENLADDKIVYAGNQKVGPMSDHYFAAWNGKTIQFISEHIEPSLDQRPNIVLLHAGTNDMNPSTTIAKQGNNPSAAARRLGKLIDKIVNKCPDATVLVAVIIGTCEPHQELNTVQYQALIPGVVQKRFDEGKHVLAVNFTSFPMKEMRSDCLHPTNNGYKLIGDYWYDFMTQIPKDWIKKPIGPDPDRSKDKEDEENGAGRLSFGSLAITFALLFHYLL